MARGGGDLYAVERGEPVAVALDDVAGGLRGVHEVLR
jgi:hypothetical protein